MSSPEPPQDSLFREEALREYARVRSEGTLLRIHPAWTRWVFLLLVATFIGAIAFAWIAKVPPTSEPDARPLPAGP